MNLHELLSVLSERQGSSLLLTAGATPRLRVNGALELLGDTPLERQQVRDLAYSVLTETQKDQFEQKGQLCCSFGIRGLSRFELTLFTQKACVSALIKRFPLERPAPPSWVSDTLPWLDAGPGLVVVAGPVGSGRSTTLGWWVDHLNRTRQVHILSVEETLTSLHAHALGVVEQIELGPDMPAADAIQFAGRAGADVIALDLATDEFVAAVTVFSSGALVFAGLRAATVEAAAAAIAKALPRSCWRSLRGLVWRQTPASGTLLAGPPLEALLTR